jgi:hypothetical protein
MGPFHDPRTGNRLLPMLGLALVIAFLLVPARIDLPHSPSSAGTPPTQGTTAPPQVKSPAPPRVEGRSVPGAAHLTALALDDYNRSSGGNGAVAGLGTIPSDSSSVTYSVAAAAVLAKASLYDGGGWSVWSAAAEATAAGSNELLSDYENSSCPTTWITSPPASGYLYLPGTPSNATPGAAATWIFVLQTGSSSAQIFASVINGSATLWFTEGAGCIQDLPQGSQAVPTTVIDSPRAVASANLAGGATFLAVFPNASRLYLVVSNTTQTQEGLPATAWLIVYLEEFSGFEYFEAVVNATSGAVVNSTGEFYPVTFTETGLPAGASWVVDLEDESNSTTLFGQNFTSQLTAVIYAPNGSYEFQVFSANNSSVGSNYLPSPATGNLTVNGSSVTEDLTFVEFGQNYNLSFVESGLPNGTNWGVDLYNSSGFVGDNFSTSSVLGFLAPNGTYHFGVFNVSVGGLIYFPIPGQANVTLDGGNATVNITFLEGPAKLTFAEAGLQGGLPWSVYLYTISVGELTNSSNTSSVRFQLAPGSYYFEIGYPRGSGAVYVPDPTSGYVSVTTTGATVDVQFTRVALYGLTFQATGLPGGIEWTVDLPNGNGSLSPVENTSTNDSLTLFVPNGSYYFEVSSPSNEGYLYVPAPASGNVTVTGAGSTVAVAFARFALFDVTFAESGLPSGTWWSVTLAGGFEEQSSDSIAFQEVNGTYGYSVGAPSGYAPSPASGSVVVKGAAVTVTISFTPIASGTYTVTFNETGLPPATNWTVDLDGTVEHSNGTALAFVEPNGSFPYRVTVASLSWQVVQQSGSVTVSGASPNTTTSDFIYAYSVSFNASSLPSGTDWSIDLLDPPGPAEGAVGPAAHPAVVESYTFSVAGTDLEFALPNGTFTYALTATGGYSVSPANGTIVMAGAPQAFTVTFNPGARGGGGGGWGSGFLSGWSRLPSPIRSVVVVTAIAGAVVIGVLVAVHSYAPAGSAGIAGGAAARRARRRARRAKSQAPGAPAAAAVPGAHPGAPPPPAAPTPASSNLLTPGPAAPAPPPPGAPDWSGAGTGPSTEMPGTVCSACSRPYGGTERFCTSCGRPR